MTILDQYFYLSDIAGKDSNAFEELSSLFAENAVLFPNGTSKIGGLKDIRSFFSKFFDTNVEMKHVWETKINGEMLETNWAVCGKRKTGEFFALVGKDIAKLNPHGKIEYLEVKIY
jgi:hypothetical protein